MIRYSEVRPEVIAGEILGNNRTYESLKPVFDDRSDVYCRIASAFPLGREQVSSTRVWLRRLFHRGWGEKLPENEPLTTVGEFECEDLLVDSPLQLEPGHAPGPVMFYLSENAKLWLRRGEVQDFQSFTLDTYKETIQAAGEPGLKIVAEPALVYDQTTGRGRMAAAIVPTLTCTANQAAAGQDAFIDETLAIVEDLLLLASVVSRCLIQWHRYSWDAKKGLQTRLRPLGSRAAARDARPADFGEMPVPLGDFGEFAREGMGKLQTLRGQGFDLSLPIIYLVTSHQSHILDERFSYALLCLERLVDYHGRGRGLSQILGRKDFDALSRSLKKHIDTQLESTSSAIVPNAGRPVSEARNLIRDKLLELNRPPFWTLLSSLLDEYGVTWKDLYPPETPRPTFKATRDKFIHSSVELDSRLVFRECQRVQALCERLIIRMLGWSTPHSPMGYIRSALAKS